MIIIMIAFNSKMCRVAAVIRLPVHHHSTDYIFWSFAITKLSLSFFEKRVPLRPVLGAWLVLRDSLPVLNRLS